MNAPEAFDADFQNGQTVIARFTAGNRSHQITGKIVGKTKNYWKVEGTEAYRTYPAGFVYKIATDAAQEFSANNRIVGLA